MDDFDRNCISALFFILIIWLITVSCQVAKLSSIQKEYTIKTREDVVRAVSTITLGEMGKYSKKVHKHQWEDDTNYKGLRYDICECGLLRIWNVLEERYYFLTLDLLTIKPDRVEPSEEEFLRLRDDIIKKDLTLEEIRNYKF